MEVRPFRLEDGPALHRVRLAAFAPIFASFRAIVGPDLAPAAFGAIEEEQGALLDRLCAEGAVLVGEREGEVAGFAAVTVSGALGELALLAVHPDHAGRGLGGRLIEAALDRMRALGATAAAVGTGGDDSHAPARRAYAKAGFGAALPNMWLYRAL